MWKELVINKFPDGNRKSVFCSRCGLKNRNDEGWFYNDKGNYIEETLKYIGNNFSSNIELLAIKQLSDYEYVCKYCAKSDSELIKIYWICEKCNKNFKLLKSGNKSKNIIKHELKNCEPTLIDYLYGKK